GTTDRLAAPGVRGARLSPSARLPCAPRHHSPPLPLPPPLHLPTLQSMVWPEHPCVPGVPDSLLDRLCQPHLHSIPPPTWRISTLAGSRSLTLRRGYSPTGSRFLPAGPPASPRRRCPRQKILLAACSSRSNTSPQCVQTWVRTDRLFCM